MLGGVRNVAAIAASRDIPPRRLAGTYVRLRTQIHRPPRLARILDFDVAYRDIHDLVLMFEEVFLLRHYPFVPERHDPVIVDCGANIGIASLYFKTLAPAARVVAFEPEPTAYSLLKSNMERNALEVRCLPIAVTSSAGDVELRTVAPAHGGASLRFGGGEWSSAVVRGERLSDHLPERVDLVKLDVEGAELDVLRELVASGAIERVGQFAIEVHATTADYLPSVLALLADAGFAYRLATPGERLWDDSPLFLVHARRPL